MSRTLFPKISTYQKEWLEVDDGHQLYIEQSGNPNGIPQAISTLFPEPTFINSMEDSAEDVSKFKAGNTIGKLIASLKKEILKLH